VSRPITLWKGIDANEKRQEKKIEEVRRPQPQWIIKKHHWINILKLWFVGFP
jgi:hypothetical protein